MRHLQETSKRCHLQEDSRIPKTRQEAEINDLEEGGDPHRRPRSKPTLQAMKRGESTLLPHEYSLKQIQREEGARRTSCSVALDGMIYVFVKA